MRARHARPQERAAAHSTLTRTLRPHGKPAGYGRAAAPGLASLGVAALLLATMGCARPAPVPDPVIARFESRTLTAGTVARWLVLGQPLPIETDVAEELAAHWLEMHALHARLMAGDSLAGDVWQLAMAESLRDSLIAADRLARYPDLPSRISAEVQRLERSDRALLIAHILRRADPGTRPAERELQRLAAERIRSRLASGGTWAEANAENEDEAARENAGVIGIVQPGELPDPLAAAAAALTPGAFGPVVESEFGYHILYRPRLDGEWRARLLDLVRADVHARADSVTAELLLDRAKPTLVPGALATVRALAREPWRSAARQDSLVVWSEGSLTAGDLALSLAFLSVPDRRRMIGADDGVLQGFVGAVLARHLTAADAERRGVRVSEPTRAAIEADFRTRVRAAADLLTASAGDAGGMTAEAREELRSAAVERLVEAVVARRAPLQPLPPLLVLHLLEQAEWTLNGDVLRGALDRARTLIAAAGSDAAAVSVR